jgi:MoaA/NifB/PqqE/SkfB family radical SAM enzyme
MNKVKCIWNLNRNCNFNCSYCYVKNEKEKVGRGVDIDIPAFKNSKIDFDNITLCGGEPFIYPNFVELCKKFTMFTKITVNTNCSTSNVYDFADSVNPKYVIELFASLHIGERKKKDYDKLIEKIHYLRNKGFNVCLTQVMHPNLFSEYKKTYDYFKTQDILIVPRPMKGVWHMKEYPQAYKEYHKRVILDYTEQSLNQASQYDANNFYSTTFGKVDWKGKKCNAGKESIIIRYDGNAYSCFGMKKHLGNLYKNNIKLNQDSMVCTANHCTCEQEGRHNHKVDGFIHTKQNYPYIIKETARDILFKLGRKSNWE